MVKIYTRIRPFSQPISVQGQRTVESLERLDDLIAVAVLVQCQVSIDIPIELCVSDMKYEKERNLKRCRVCLLIGRGKERKGAEGKCRNDAMGSTYNQVGVVIICLPYALGKISVRK